MKRGSSAIDRRAPFREVRYANCWEDAEVVASALSPLAGAHCVSIASAGDNCLSLLARGAGSVVAVDLNPAQLALVELKLAAVRHLEHLALVSFLGADAPPEAGGRHGDDRLGTYRQLREGLGDWARHYWDARPREIAAGVVHAGRLESYFRLFRRRVLPLVHRRDTVAALFEPRERAQREHFYDHTWDTPRWRWLFRLFFGRHAQGWIGRDPEFLRFADRPVAGTLLARTRAGLTAVAPAENPYLRFILTGAFGKTLPDYLLPQRQAAIRERLDRLTLRLGPVEAVVASLEPARVDAFNLSDVAEYMDRGHYHGLLQALRPAAAPGARLAYWNLFADRQRPASAAAWLEARSDTARVLHQGARAFFYTRLVLEVVR